MQKKGVLVAFGWLWTVEMKSRGIALVLMLLYSYAAEKSPKRNVPGRIEGRRENIDSI
jgi:hypothetical protein